MSGCILCTWLRSTACADADRLYASFWSASADWESRFAAENGFWPDESDETRGLIDRARAIDESEPTAALELYVQAAANGSPEASEMVGWYYETGAVVAADIDLASEHYHRAVSAGSWRATVGYARLLEKRGYVDHAEQLLNDGVEAGFVPAHFWLAYLRYRRSPTRKTCHQVRPLMEYAAASGHLVAEWTVARWMARGTLGIRRIPQGLRRLVALSRRFPTGPGGENAGTPVEPPLVAAFQ